MARRSITQELRKAERDLEAFKAGVVAGELVAGKLADVYREVSENEIAQEIVTEKLAEMLAYVDECRRSVTWARETIIGLKALLTPFEFKGVWITDPFMDETGRFAVDPSDYYGINA